MPTYALVELPTPSDPNPDPDGGEYQEGNSGDGVMFYVVAAGALAVYSITFSQMVSTATS